MNDSIQLKSTIRHVCRPHYMGMLVILMVLVISGCQQEQREPVTTKPTPEPYTLPVAIGAWVGDISIPLGQNENESANIRFLISENGKKIDYYQLYLTSCSTIDGGSGIPINQGTFSFSLEQSCDYSGTITVSGVFVSVDKLVGTVKAGSQTSYWEASLAD